jgi:hypothetical protein
MRTFLVVVSHVFAHQFPEMCLAQRHHSVETLFLDRTVEPLYVGIQVRTAPGQADRPDPVANVRLCAMHARPISLDDDLLLRTEVRRILKAIGVI